MYVLAQIALKNYVPEKIEAGMFFANWQAGELWTTTAEHQDKDVEPFVATHGYPFQIGIVSIDDENAVIVDEKPLLIVIRDNEPVPLTTSHINVIGQMYEGAVELDVFDPISMLPLLINGAAVIRYPREAQIQQEEKEDE